MNLHHLAHTLRAHRLRRNWTQRQLSDASDVSEKYIARLENGKAGKPCNISVTVLLKLGNALEIDAVELLRNVLPAPRARAGKPISFRLLAGQLARMEIRKTKVIAELIALLVDE